MHVQSARFDVRITPPPAAARQGEQVIFLHLEGGLYRQPLEAPLSAVAHHGEDCSCTEDKAIQTDKTANYKHIIYIELFTMEAHQSVNKSFKANNYNLHSCLFQSI